MTTTTSASAAPPASIGRRVAGFLIDAAIAAVLGGIAGGFGLILLRGGGTPSELVAGAGAAAAVVMLTALVWAVVYAAMQGGKGSFGQRIVGVRLADAESGAPVGFWRALVRNVVFGLASSIVVGYFTPLFDASGRRQGWHDAVARAVVVVASRGSAGPVPATTDAVAPGTVPAVPPIPTATSVFAALSPSGAAPAPALPSAPTRESASSFPSSSDEVISVVPGVAPGSLSRDAPAPASTASAARPDAAVASVAPAASVALPASASPGADPVATIGRRSVAESSDEEPQASDETVLSAARPRAVVALRWDDGTRVGIYGRTLFGRNPSSEPDATTIAVRDETLSLSKTHFEVGGDAASGAWIVDRHSTNGTILVRDRAREALAPGVRTPLRAGDRLEFGDRSVEVGDPS